MNFKNWAVKVGSLLAISICTQVNASGFALIEQSVSSLGNAYAGAGTSAYDASVLYFNPAGMTKICGNQL
ncbi:MAG: outer membrane protein transport protein, partial [Waddliaceae bacterium]